MYPHRIRLRGPWEWALPTGDVRSITMPCRREDLAAALEPLPLLRRFGYPGQLDDRERIWITFTALNAIAAVSLNERSLGAGQRGTFELEATGLLAARNRLALELTSLPSSGPLWDEVALEIRRLAYLRATARRLASGDIEIFATAIGPPGPTFDLYAIAERHTLHDQRLDAGDTVQFILPSPGPIATVQLDLVQGAESWCSLDVPVQAAEST